MAKDWRDAEIKRSALFRLLRFHVGEAHLFPLRHARRNVEPLLPRDRLQGDRIGGAGDHYAGMVAANVLHGDMPIAHWDRLDGAFLLDVRQPAELVVESVPGAVNIPLPELRSRLSELPKEREIAIICRSAQRAYYATRILLQNGFKARNLSGGTLARAMLSADR